MQDLQTNIRELILSSNPDSCLLGLILNDSYKCFPNVRKFYQKNKRANFWHNNRVQTVTVSQNRYYALTAVLNNELKTHKCYFWLNYYDSINTPWFNWQYRILKGLKPISRSSYYIRWVSHPYTTMFVRRP
jgi:hypothetical protein